MNEWARLVDRYASELKKYEMVCAFCGQHLSDTNINDDCLENAKAGEPARPSGRNAPKQDEPEVVDPNLYFTEQAPNKEFFGKKRHFFGKPSFKGLAQNPF